MLLGIGCGSVGRAVASDTRGLRFESSHWVTLYYLYSVNCFEKTKIILRKVIDGKTKESGHCRGNLQPKNGQLIEN